MPLSWRQVSEVESRPSEGLKPFAIVALYLRKSLPREVLFFLDKLRGTENVA